MSSDSKEAGEGGLVQGLDAVRTYWDERATRHGDDCVKIESSKRAQRMRFESFVLSHELAGRSILDVGCGTGDLLEHLDARGVKCSYHGVDLSGEMIGAAQAKHRSGTFEAANILDWDPSNEARRFDYVVSFAIHNVRVPGGRELLEKLTRQQFALCRVAAHVDLLTDRFQGFDPHIQPWRAEEILTLALSITPYVVLRHDYLPNDFSVTMYREPLIDTRRDLMLER